MYNFLKKVLPEGLTVIATPSGKGFKQVVVNTFEDAVREATHIDCAGKDSYFGLGALIEPFVLSADGKKKEIRVGKNIAGLKCLFIDMDVEAGNENKYENQVEAIAALKQFCKATSFPSPMLVNSGFGIHAYWPVEDVIPAGEWRVLAATFKAALGAYGLKTDPTITADASRVLRVPGTHNYKRGASLPVEILKDVTPYPNQILHAAVTKLALEYHITPRTMPAIKVETTSILGDNLEKVYEDSDFHKIVQHCATMANILATGGPGGVIWIHGLAIAMVTTDGEDACLEISKNHPEFDVDDMKRRIYRLKDQKIGPTRCETFCNDEDNKCEGCVHKGKINSPISLGHAEVRHMPVAREAINAETGEVEKLDVPPLPFPYNLDSKGRVAISIGNGDAAELVVVCDLIIYPLKCMHNERMDAETTLWRILRTNEPPRDFMLIQSALAKPESLHAELLAKGVYLLPGQVKLMVGYMLSYLKQLRQDHKVELLFSRLGWRDNYTKFVLGTTLFKSDGTTEEHQMSPEILSEVPGLEPTGSLDGWKDTIQFYNAAGHEAHRIMLYSGFGSIILHMTGHNGVVIAATGEPGAGKTTAMLASNSIFGHPDKLLVSGNASGATENALYALQASRNHLPMALDEVTKMDLQVLGRSCLAAPQGKAKVRLLRSGAIAPNALPWGNIVQMSANTDMYSSLAQSRADASAEAVRLLQLPFVMPLTRTKAQSDQFLRELRVNHGHAGRVFIQYVAENYAIIKTRVESMMGYVDTAGQITSGERFWSGCIAAIAVGAMCARKLGVLNSFPVEDDLQWILGQLVQARKSMKEHISSPREILSEFLESTISNTLVINMTQGNNIAPRIEQEPRGSLSIRHELDAGVVYLLKSAFKTYCTDIGANYKSIQSDLEEKGVLLNHNKQMVLGKGTDFGKGQVRCWEIDMRKL